EADVVVGEALPEGHALLSAPAHKLERPLRDTDLAHAVVDPPGAEPPLRDLEAAAVPEEQVRGRYPDVLEEDLAVPVGCVVVAVDAEHAQDADPSRVAGHENHRLLLVAVGVPGVRLAHEDDDLAARIPDPRGPPLAAVDDVLAPVPDDARLDVGRV